MDFGLLARRAKQIAADNSPAILTALAVTGTLTTAYLTGKASFKAVEVIDKEQRRWDENETSRLLYPKEKVEAVWKLYIPAAGTAALTVAAIIGVNQIGYRKTAALATAYSLSEKAFEEYKGKVLTKFGEEKEKQVRDEINQDHVTANPPGKSSVVVMGNGQSLWLDVRTGRYFLSTLEDVKKAMNDTNYVILNNNYASVTDFYDLLGLPPTDESDELGWNSDKMIDLDFGAAMTEDGRPCLTMAFVHRPFANYYKQY